MPVLVILGAERSWALFLGRRAQLGAVLGAPSLRGGASAAKHWPLEARDLAIGIISRPKGRSRRLRLDAKRQSPAGSTAAGSPCERTGETHRSTPITAISASMATLTNATTLDTNSRSASLSTVAT